MNALRLAARLRGFDQNSLIMWANQVIKRSSLTCLVAEPVLLITGRSVGSWSPLAGTSRTMPSRKRHLRSLWLCTPGAACRDQRGGSALTSNPLLSPSGTELSTLDSGDLGGSWRIRTAVLPIRSLMTHTLEGSLRCESTVVGSSAAQLAGHCPTLSGGLHDQSVWLFAST